MAAHASSNSRLRIFISYGHDEHVSLALRLKEDLIARGHEVWFDLDRLKPGADWERYIEEGLNWASRDGNGRVILIMTPYSVKRPDGFCLNELARALTKNLKVMPIMLVWCEPPLSICRIQWVDMQDCLPLDERHEKYRVKFERLLEALERDMLDFEGYHSHLFNVLKPLSFDSEVRYNLDKFTGRDWVFDEIDRWLEDASASRLFWISGGPGVGKTAISSYLTARRPEIVAFHFCRYDNVQKRDPRRAVMSLAYQLSTQLPDYEMRLRRIKLDDLDGQDAKTLFDHLIVQPLAANYPMPGRKVVVLIDALDEATIEGKNEMASFISSGLERTPSWLRLIVTSRPNAEVVGPLQSYTPFVIDINDPRNNLDIKAYLTRELRRLKPDLEPGVIDTVARKTSGLFLYAEWIVAELWQGRLSLDRLDEFPQGLGGIYLKFFERQFPDISDWETRVIPALEVIAASQEPLGLSTLGNIFNWSVREERRFRLSLGALFRFDHGVQPFHKSIVEWLSNEEKLDPYYISIEEGHKRLAGHLWKQYRSSLWSAYMVNYIPLHLCMAERWAELEEVLLDMKFVRAAWEAGKFRFMGQWSFIEARSPLRMADLYGRMDLNAKAAEDNGGLLAVAKLLVLTMRTDTGLKLLDFLIRYYRETNELQKLSEALDKYSNLIGKNGEFQKALTIAQECEGICRKTGDKPRLLSVLLNQFSIYVSLGRFDRAYGMMAETESLLRELDDVEKLLWYMTNKAIILYFGENDINGGLAALLEHEKIAREHGQIFQLAQCLNNMGDWYRDKGEYGRAISLFKESVQISRSLGDRLLLCCTLNNEGLALEALGKLDEAMAVLLEAEKMIREAKMGINLMVNIQGQGRVLAHKGQYREALSYYSEAERLSRDKGEYILLAELLGDRAMALVRLGDEAGAMSLLKEEEMLCREHGLKRNLEVCLEQQKSLAMRKIMPQPIININNR